MVERKEEDTNNDYVSTPEKTNDWEKQYSKPGTNSDVSKGNICSTSSPRRATHVSNAVISHEEERDRITSSCPTLNI